MLSLKQVSKSFGQNNILSGVDLDVQPGEIIGLAGPSGSGKSTLLRCIQKLEGIDSGSIECLSSTGFMFQDFQLFPHMTVLNNLIYSTKFQCNKTNHMGHALELLDKLKLLSKKDNFPNQLSGGQKQRVAFARTMMTKPGILLCDEPTSGLDLATIDDVVELLLTVKQAGVTMLIASHDLDFLTRISDRLIVLRKGQIQMDIESSQIQNFEGKLKSIYTDDETGQAS